MPSSFGLRVEPRRKSLLEPLYYQGQLTPVRRFDTKRDPATLNHQITQIEIKTHLRLKENLFKQIPHLLV
jgi:hypothetical protein